MRAGNVGLEGGQLRSIVERIEQLEEEIRSLNDEKKDVLLRGKGRRFRCDDHTRGGAAQERRP